MSHVPPTLAKIQFKTTFWNGKNVTNVFAFVIAPIRCIQRNNKNFKFVLTLTSISEKCGQETCTLTWSYVSYCLHDLVQNQPSHHVQFNFSWTIQSSNRVLHDQLNCNNVAKSMSRNCSSWKHKPSVQWESWTAWVSLLTFKNWKFPNTKKELTTK